MLETNIRIVLPGQNLYVWTRRAKVDGPGATPDLLQRTCGRLRYRHGLAAIPARGRSPALLVGTDRPLAPIHLEGDAWELDVLDDGGPSRRLTLADTDGPELLPLLIERALEVTLAHETDLWTLDSPRIWYEAKPFTERDGIAAYRRYEVSALALDGEGIGIAVDIGTAFFTVAHLAYFFDPDVPAAEHHRRAGWFAELTRRQEGQKGTLVYDNGRSRIKCYFEDAPRGVTCANTGKIRVKGRSYDSLLAYYRAEYPELAVGADTPAVRVSFRELDRPQFVAADRLRARVMNDDVPDALSSVDKIVPAERRSLVHAFWQRLGSRPLGRVAPGMRPGFWRPQGERVLHLVPPTLIFGKGRRLGEPATNTVGAYRAHYHQRGDCLEKDGCYAAPPTMVRTLYCAYPKHVTSCVAERLASDLADAISAWSGYRVTPSLVAYDDVADAVAQLRAADEGGVVVFILNDQPAAYHDAAFHLGDWRIKRSTERVLRRQYDYLTKGAWDKRSRSKSLTLGAARWRSFVTLDALDVLQLLDAIPFRSEQAGPYEAHLVIDVGHDRRHFALSLLVARPTGKSPDFRLVTHVEPKADHQHETINAVVLRDQIVDLVQSTLRRPSDPLASLLVLRDGLLGQQEVQGIDQALATLADLGKVVPDARVDLAEFHKDTLKSLRLWEVYADGTVDNLLEGIVVRLDAKTVLVATTGAATLRQGTAEPFLIMGDGRCSSILDAARATFGGAQLNWSSPTTAQRLHVALKRTDEELKARAAQEIRRLR